MADKSVKHPGGSEALAQKWRDLGDGSYAPSVYNEAPAASGGGAVTVADGADVALGATTDLASANTAVGRLKAIANALAGTIAISGPVTIASLPLPTGASTEATLASLLAKVNASIAVTGSFWQATQPVSIAAMPSTPVTGTFWQATQPVSLASVPTHAVTQGTSPWLTAGRITAGSTPADNPIPIGAAYRINQPTYVADALAELQADTRGNLKTVLGDINANTFARVLNGGDGVAAGLFGLKTYSMGYLFNGVSEDRARGNWDTTTGDTGAKAATFPGITQTNYNSVGAIITVKLGTVSGTTPTLSCQLQWSYDGGVSWMNVGPAMANLTATGQIGVFFLYPSNTSQAAGVTPANLTTGATQTVVLNLSLPRVWRILFTIGGTGPSFALTAVYVNYTL